MAFKFILPGFWTIENNTEKPNESIRIAWNKFLLEINNTRLIHLKSIGGGVGKERLQYLQNVYVQNLWQWSNSNDNSILC